MAIFASRWFAVLALIAVCFDLSSRPLCAQAEEGAESGDAAAAQAGDVEVTDSGEASGEAAEASEDGEGDETKGQQFVDSARELQEKLAQLKALLDAKGEGADPGLKEKLAGLESQLAGLGLDGLGGAGSNPELTEFLGACLTMAMRRAGMQRPATLGALRKLADNKLTPEEASKQELWKMVGVCVGDFREDEFADYKSGKMKILPKAYVDASKKPEAEQKVLEIDAQVWEELRRLSEGLLKELAGGSGENPPFNAAYLALIPFGLAVAFMAKKFLDMQKGKEDKGKAKKGSKKDK